MSNKFMTTLERPLTPGDQKVAIKVAPQDLLNFLAHQLDIVALSPTTNNKCAASLSVKVT